MTGIEKKQLLKQKCIEKKETFIMTERLTREQMETKYPNQWLGIRNVKCRNNDGITIESAEVVYVGKDKDELLEMQIDETDGIIGWYTSENNLQLGLVGVL